MLLVTLKLGKLYLNSHYKVKTLSVIYSLQMVQNTYSFLLFIDCWDPYVIK